MSILFKRRTEQHEARTRHRESLPWFGSSGSRLRLLASAATLVVAAGTLAACGSGNNHKQNSQSQTANSSNQNAMIGAQPSTRSGASSSPRQKRLTPNEMNQSQPSGDQSSSSANSGEKRVTPQEMGSPSSGGA